MDKPKGREVRFAVDTWPDLDVRATGDGLTFRGYAAVFDSWSEDLGGFRERIRPGAFRKSLTEKRAIKMFHNHNSDIVLGSTRAGTLKLVEDERGLLAETTLPDNQWGHVVRDAVARGDIDSMSFGFQTVKDAWAKEDERVAERELVEVRLFEVSDVSGWPAYAATSATVRELAEAIDADADELVAAFGVLRDPEARLTAKQHDLLLAAINTRYDLPVVPPRLAAKRVAFEDLLTFLPAS